MFGEIPCDQSSESQKVVAQARRQAANPSKMEKCLLRPGESQKNEEMVAQALEWGWFGA